MADAADKLRILVIDDSEAILAKVAAALEAAGYDVVTTTQPSGNARHLVKCDLVIIDFHMPGIGGSDVLASLRAAAEGAGRKCPFYLYTSDPAAADDYARFGFDGAISQKGQMTALVAQVHMIARMIRMRRLAKGAK